VYTTLGRRRPRAVRITEILDAIPGVWEWTQETLARWPLEAGSNCGEAVPLGLNESNRNCS
jgi:hypothetical protein